jgi:hypothetical protein
MSEMTVETMKIEEGRKDEGREDEGRERDLSTVKITLNQQAHRAVSFR